ncbi:MAG: aminotransferase class V-fold PLP-dependent enzyme [Thermoplasmatota archaeon]
MDPIYIRKEFPILSDERENPLIYFDNACMTLRPKRVIDKLVEYYTEYPGCGGRSLHKISSRVTDNFERSREIIKDFIGAPDIDGVVFTKNTTESINLVASSFRFQKGDLVLGTDHEHNSNLVPWVHLMSKGKIEYRPVPSLEDHSFDMEAYKDMVKGARLVSMVHVSNLDGRMIPAKEIIEIAHDSGALVLLDCAQSVPHLPIDMKNLDLDLMAFSGHKAMGPTGTGVLAGRKEIIEELDPYIVGGDTVLETRYDSVEFLAPPKRFEAGLQHYPGFIGLGEALRFLDEMGVNEVHEHEISLNGYATSRLKDLIEIQGPSDPKDRGGILPFIVGGLNSHDIAMMLDELANIALRSGRHCVHSWFNSRKVESTARASFYAYNTREEIDLLAETLEVIIRDFT